MVVYSFALGAGAGIGPAIAGLIYSGIHKWLSIFRISAIFTGANLLSFIILLPKTTQVKDHVESLRDNKKGNTSLFYLPKMLKDPWFKVLNDFL